VTAYQMLYGTSRVYAQQVFERVRFAGLRCQTSCRPPYFRAGWRRWIERDHASRDIFENRFHQTAAGAPIPARLAEDSE